MQYDICIIGAGIVGLGAAYQLQRQRPDLRMLVLDKADRVAAHQTGHNSGVIHSGIYYRPGSARATHCLAGYRQLLAFCDAHHVPYSLCGKIIVAVQADEKPRLADIYQRGLANGLTGIRWLKNPEEIKEIEPHAGGLEAIYVPQAGIVDYTAVANAYARILQQGNAELWLGAAVQGISRTAPGQLVVQTTRGDVHTRMVINCAGLYSDRITQLTMPESKVQILPFRGEYYQLRPEAEHLVRGLIYPTPNPHFPFLGVHFTRLIGGGVEAGPNAVLAFAREGYRFTTLNLAELRETLQYPGFRKLALRHWRYGLGEMQRSLFKSAFVRALQPLLPVITADDLEPGGAGVRAMACLPEGELSDDFLFYDMPGVINVANAPSPAATASLAIGDTIAARALAQLA